MMLLNSFHDYAEVHVASRSTFEDAFGVEGGVYGTIISEILLVKERERERIFGIK
jgi:hypothetical protein